MADFLEFNDISQEFKGAMNGGRLKLHKQGVVFKNNRTGKVEQVHVEDLDKTKWLRAARGHELKLFMKNGTIFRYDGFKEGDYDKLSDYIKKHYSLSLEEVELSLKGWNWGEAKFKGSEMSFKVDNKAAFNIPLNNVSHSAIGKNEITIEFHQNDDAAVSLMEMRFFVPPTDGETDPIEEFHKNILAKADIIQATGDAIATFTEIPCLTPRGRYDVKIYPTFLQLHGKTFDYKIPYTTVLRLFLLPHKDQRQMFFVMSLDPPIKQGQTRYQHIILSFNKEDEISLTLNLTDEDIEQKFEGKLQKEMSGILYEIVSRIMKALVNRKITVPGNFKGKSGTSAISCSYKSNSGFLYPLERGVIFVHKPPLHIRFDEITCVNFARGTGSSRYFDFEIETTSNNQFVFSSIEKDEYSKLYDFVSTKRLKIKNVGVKSRVNVGEYDDLIGSDDEDAHDAYLEHVKAEGRQREEYESEESDDESDESFNPGDSSSVAEEYDSNAVSSESEDEGASGSETKKKKEKESKPKRKTKTVSEKPRKKRKKKEKDPNKPKRPPTAYFIFLNENREKIKSERPGMSVAEVTKRGGELWSSMTEKDKEGFVARAKELKAEYDIKMQAYKARPQEGDDSDAETTPKKQKRPKAADKKMQKSPSKAGSGTNYKSKEYISSESSDSESSVSSDDKPLKPSKKSKKEDEDDELPSEEEILSTPPSSDKSEESDASEDDDDDDDDDDDHDE
ncbi:FACT complex subunit SSRP1-like [Ptychodera flava]|uniref:FACT complex subunit SSRP1-like n=1 Tax=Ptychodera flava TaxID=63121 RepID=UPI00396A83C8